MSMYNYIDVYLKKQYNTSLYYDLDHLHLLYNVHEYTIQSNIIHSTNSNIQSWIT